VSKLALVTSQNSQYTVLNCAMWCADIGLYFRRWQQVSVLGSVALCTSPNVMMDDTSPHGLFVFCWCEFIVYKTHSLNITTFEL